MIEPSGAPYHFPVILLDFTVFPASFLALVVPCGTYLSDVLIDFIVFPAFFSH